MTPSTRRLLPRFRLFQFRGSGHVEEGFRVLGEVEKEQNVETSLGMGFGVYGILGWWGRKNSEASMGCKVFFAGFWRGRTWNGESNAKGNGQLNGS